MKGHEHKNYSRRGRNSKETSKKEEMTKDKDDAELEEYSTKKIQRITVESIGRTGGVYIPPFKLARLQVNVSKDTGSHEYQRQSWEALRKSINGLVNKVNVGNIRNLVQVHMF
jgi:pre-mRNA-splicing factor CWC22